MRWKFWLRGKENYFWVTPWPKSKMWWIIINLPWNLLTSEWSQTLVKCIYVKQKTNLWLGSWVGSIYKTVNLLTPKEDWLLLINWYNLVSKIKSTLKTYYCICFIFYLNWLSLFSVQPLLKITLPINLPISLTWFVFCSNIIHYLHSPLILHVVMLCSLYNRQQNFYNSN